MSPRTFTRHTDGVDKIIYAEYINQLQVALEDDDTRIDGKAALVHSHTQAQVTGLETRLTNIDSLIAGKANTSHTHSASAITSGVLGASFLPIGTSEGTVAAGNHTHSGYVTTSTMNDRFISVDAHMLRTDNPHSTTKSQVGLGNVDNTSDSAKPISSATQTALNGKANTTHTHAATDVTSGTFALARLPTGTTAATVALGAHTHSAADITSGVLGTSIIPALDAAKITSGTFDTARIPSLAASKITSGTMALAQLPTGTTSSTIAIGDHKHNPNITDASPGSLWAATHKVVTATPPRTQPTTSAYTQGGALAVDQQVTRIGTFSITSNGLSWVQIHHYQRGICYFPLDYLTTV